MLKKLNNKIIYLLIFSLFFIVIPGLIIFSIRIKPEKKIFRVIRIKNNKISDWEVQNYNELIIKNLVKEEGYEKSNIRIQRYKKVTVYNISKINERAFIPIFTFHSISNNMLISISKENFEDFLIYLKSKNFYFLSPEQLIKKDFTHIPNGKKICILTADDAAPGQFILKKNNSKLLVDSDSMMGIINKHIKDKYHNKTNFIFFVSFDGVPFGQDYLVKKKLNYIADNYFIGNHTQNHYYVKNITPEEFKNEIDEGFKSFEYYLGNKYKKVIFLAYPYGINEIPDKYKKILDNYSYKDHKLYGAFDCVGKYALSPYSKKFNKWDIERIAVDNNNVKYVKMDLDFYDVFTSERMRIFVYKDKITINNKTEYPDELEFHIYPIF